MDRKHHQAARERLRPDPLYLNIVPDIRSSRISAKIRRHHRHDNAVRERLNDSTLCRISSLNLAELASFQGEIETGSIVLKRNANYKPDIRRSLDWPNKNWASRLGLVPPLWACFFFKRNIKLKINSKIRNKTVKQEGLHNCQWDI